MGNTNGVRALDEDEVLLLLRTRNEELRQETKELREAIAEKDAALLKAKDDSTAALLKTKDDSAEASRQVASVQDGETRPDSEPRDLVGARVARVHRARIHEFYSTSISNYHVWHTYLSVIGVAVLENANDRRKVLADNGGTKHTAIFCKMRNICS